MANHSTKHPCLEVPPHLNRRDQPPELPERVSRLRRLFRRISRRRSPVTSL